MVVFQIPMYVAELLVSDHFVLKLDPILAFVLKLREYFASHYQVFEVHGDLAKCFKDPVKAMERLLVFFLNHGAE